MEVIHSLSQGGDRSRNLIRRNGGFEVWQRGTSFVVAPGPSAYTADGWYINVTGANETSTVSRVAGLSNGSQWAAKVQRNVGQTGTTNVILFGFPLDTDELFPTLNCYLRLSFLAKAGANFSATSGMLSVRVRAGTGPPSRYASGFTAETAPILTDVPITTTATRFELVSALVATNVRQMDVYFSWLPTGTAGADDSFTIDDVQLEVVDSPSQPASPFERMQFTDELLLCQRHFFKTFDYDEVPIAGTDVGGSYVAGAGASGASAGAGRPMCGLRFPVPMRVTPTVVTMNPVIANVQVRNRNAAVDHSATSPVPSSVSTRIVSTGNAGGAAGQYIGIQLTADAGI